MANLTRNFIAGRMNKVVDERLLPDGEYIDAMNVRMGSTENAEIGVIENTKGNLPLTSLAYTNGIPLSPNARCIGAIEDSARETIYWFVHDPNFSVGATGKLDLIVSYNVYTDILTYHIISINDGSNLATTLNFNPAYLITGVNIIEDLLFFTDDYNPPRVINIKKNYANPVGNIDQFSGESILVIKKPPTQSPTVQLITTGGQENYLEDRFICFAYRYQYENGEYSATSQWSDVAFIPNPFEFSINSMLNEGMTNFCNTAIVSYNSGGPLVIGIDLLFKQSNNNIIKVIEKINKADSGLADNQTYQFSFNNSKIFTVLSEAEILRLYDNVPRFAKAQTIMGNRLMYGNYVEGYDLVDKNGNPIKLEYNAKFITEQIGATDVPDRTVSGDYSVNGPVAIPNSIVYIDLAGANLVAGSFISVNIKFSHSSFTGNIPFPSETTDDTEVTFDFFLNTSYSSVYALASSVEFQEAVGTAANILPVYDATPGAETSCDGTTFTDQVNCILPNNLDALQKVASGITAVNQPIKIITTPASTEIGFQLCAMKYTDNPTTQAGFVYEYYAINFADATFQEIGNPRSLHSNRGYEIGLVYMDEFNRASTALVSPNNAVHIPCGFSANKNSIQVTIPPTQRAPYWAKRYKFVIKPDEENYETIYSNLFFTDPNTNSVWFYLEGENTKKIEIGDRLIVKADTDGPKTNCAYATVLDKQAQQSGFIEPVGDVTVPSGLYIKINPNTFSAVLDPDAIVDLGEDRRCAPKGGNYTILRYPVNINKGAGFDPSNPSWEYEDFTIPAGSIINITLDWNRRGVGGSCEPRGYLFERRLTASTDYDNFQDWWNGDNVAQLLDTGIAKDGSTELEYLPANGYLTQTDFSTMYLQFYRDPVTNLSVLQMSSGKSCTGVGYPNSRKYCVKAKIEVFRAVDLIIFETEPQDALPDVFFENNLSFAIDENGNHLGNVQNQNITTNTPAIIDTGFFNCFAFGNGAESYKIRDSIVGRSFNLGERVTTVAQQDYEEADRFADITYSGNFNLETNVNRLNEFNKGLSNYKNCEASFGEIFILDGRETDVLVLQEDKISYVLAEKNLLSDASAGNIITATPEVLGTQIARTEKYGISFNPESYVQWGYDRYFTDVKRGAVLQIKGDSFQSDQLVIISEQNMRTWFRDTFNDSFNTQKLGGFDPYMNEYVLSINEELLPVNPQCKNCGISQTFTLTSLNNQTKIESFCVDLGPAVGNTEVSWNVISIDPAPTNFKVTATYNGNSVTSGYITTDGVLTFDKDNISVETVDITIEYSGNIVLSLIAECCQAEELNIVEVVITNDSEAGQTIHTQYRYTDGTFVGPLLSNLVVFGSGAGTPLVSRYNITTGTVGTGGFPTASSTMILSTNKIVPDTFNFDIAQDKFKYLRTNTLYNNNNTDIQAMLAASTTATPNQGSDPLFYADFVVPASGDYLYLIWDLRDAILTELCFATNVKDACCDCTPGNYYLNASFENSTSIFTDANMTTFAPNGFYSFGGIVRELVDGVLLPAQACGTCGVEVSLCFGTNANDVCCDCNETCDTPFNAYTVNNQKGASAGLVGIYNQDGIYEEISIPAGAILTICSIGYPVSLNPSVIVTVTFQSCDCLI